MSNFFLAIFLSTIFLGCSRSILSKSDLKWNPYKGNEVLIFKNNLGEVDTIFVQRIQQRKVQNDPLDAFPKYHEVLEVFVKYTNPVPLHKDYYLEGIFFELTSTKNKNTQVEFSIAGHKALFYSGDYTISELDSLPVSMLETNHFTYTDVIQLKPKSNEYYERNEFITTVYWSKNKGYIRFDLKNGIYWELQ